MPNESQNTPILEAIVSRYSVSPRRLNEPGPNQDQLDDLMRAAAAAPDHGRLHPWRFIHFPKECRARLAGVFEAAALELKPDASREELARAREKAASGPCLLGVVSKVQEPHAIVTRDEQLISCGAALQNIILAAQEQGFGMRAVSGHRLHTDIFRKAIGLAENEIFQCFLVIGTAEGAPKKRERPGPEDLLKTWERSPL
ncbi:nitroreductase family protein [Flexibacterium corallicola]|uniref:nitroreductase family protein n=1 Tax=Flexibacterium corallicola TaxID=3037259 RepID=UPI00286F15C3|nr:nitroreductase [Pseudovibrio sp. M1P-2-3]